MTPEPSPPPPDKAKFTVSEPIERPLWMKAVPAPGPPKMPPLMMIDGSPFAKMPAEFAPDEASVPSRLPLMSTFEIAPSERTTALSRPVPAVRLSRMVSEAKFPSDRMLPESAPAPPVKSSPMNTLPKPAPAAIEPLRTPAPPVTSPLMVSDLIMPPARMRPEFTPPPPKMPWLRSVPILADVMSRSQSMTPVSSLAASAAVFPKMDAPTKSVPSFASVVSWFCVLRPSAMRMRASLMSSSTVSFVTSPVIVLTRSGAGFSAVGDGTGTCVPVPRIPMDFTVRLAMPIFKPEPPASIWPMSPSMMILPSETPTAFMAPTSTNPSPPAPMVDVTVMPTPFTVLPLLAMTGNFVKSMRWRTCAVL